MRRNNSRLVPYARAPARFVHQPNQCALQSRTTDEDTTDDTTPQRQSSTNLAQRDNFDRVANMAREAYNIGKELLGELNVEDKIYTISKTNQRPDWYNNLGLTILNSVPQSVNEQGRTGDSIMCRGIHFEIRIMNNTKVAWGVGETQYVRCFMALQAQTNQAMNNFPSSISAGDGIWDYELQSTVLAPYAQKDYDCKARLHILWDTVVKLDAQNPNTMIKHFQKLHFHTQFENDSSSTNTGTLYFGIVADRAVADGSVDVNWHSRLYFVDN